MTERVVVRRGRRPAVPVVFAALAALACVLAVAAVVVLRPAPALTLAQALVPATPVAVSVSGQSVGRAGTGFAGFSYEKDRVGAGMFDPADTELVGLFRRLGPSVLRVGGNLVDIVNWNAAGAGGSAGSIAPADVTKLGAFLRATGWSAIYGINLKTNTAANAASEAQFVAHALGDRLMAFEIGNEPSYYQTESGYEASFNAYVGAIRAEVPGAVFDGPGAYQDAGWLAPFAAHEKDNGLAMLSMHTYTGNGATGTIAKMFAGYPAKFAADEAALAAAAASSGIADWRLSEVNSFHTGGAAGVSDTQAAALWSLDMMYGVASHGGSGVNFHGGTSTQFPLHYSPIVFSGLRPTGVVGVYYGELLWTLAGPGPVHPASVSGRGPAAVGGVTAWGIGADVVVNNKGSTAVRASVALPAAPARARLYVMTAPSLESRATTIAGSAVSVSGAFRPSPSSVPVHGHRVVVLVPAGSAALIVTG